MRVQVRCKVYCTGTRSRSRQESVIEARCEAGTGRNACATERRRRRPEASGTKGTAKCRSLVGCGLCRDDSSREWAVREVLIHGDAIKTPRKPFNSNNLTISNRR